MFQLRLIHIPRPSSKQIILGSLGGSVVIVGIIVAVPFFIVETIIHPKKKTLFDRYTISPFELDIPAEAVTLPPLCGDYKVSGWYIVRVQGDILLCVASVFTYVDTPKTTGDTRNVIYATEHFLFLHYT